MILYRRFIWQSNTLQQINHISLSLAENLLHRLCNNYIKRAKVQHPCTCNLSVALFNTNGAMSVHNSEDSTFYPSYRRNMRVKLLQEQNTVDSVVM